jgi:predicted ATPase
MEPVIIGAKDYIMTRNPGYRLTELTVSGFKSIRETAAPIQLNQLNVLIGANGSGKSNFVGVLSFLRQLATEVLQSHIAYSGWANAILFMGTANTAGMSIGLKIEFDNDSLGYLVKLVPTKDDHLAIESEAIIEADSSGDLLASKRILDSSSGSRESLLRRARDAGDTAANAIWAYLNDLICFHFVDTSWMTRAADAEFYRYLYPDGRNLASYLLYLREQFPAYYRRVVDTVRMVAPFFGDFVLEPEIRNPKHMFLRWKQAGSEHVFHGAQLSDGTLRFAALAALLNQPVTPAIIVLDEPELGLHPAAINILGGLLQSAAVYTQIIVSTQSVLLLDNFEPENVIVVERHNDQSVFRRLDTNKLAAWLEDYSIGELWEKNVIGGRPWS